MPLFRSVHQMRILGELYLHPDDEYHIARIMAMTPNFLVILVGTVLALQRLSKYPRPCWIILAALAIDAFSRLVLPVVMQSLLSSPLVVLARDDHPLAGAARISLERIAQEPLLLREPGSGTRLLVNRLFEQHRLNPTIRLQLNTDEAIKEAILAGLGVAILSRFTHGSRQEPAHLVCLDVEGFPLENRWHIAYPVGRQPGATAREFMEFARVETRRLLQATTEAAVTA